MNTIKINDNLNLEWLGHASFLINFNKLNIFIDPYKISTDKKADIIFLTHDHHDHLRIEDLNNLIKKETIIFLPESGVSKLDELNMNIKKIIVNPSFTDSLEGFKVKAVPAYNTNKKFHPKENNWVGYIFDFDGLKIYHSGDTDVINEMKGFDVDIALLPVGGTYTVDAKKAAKACEYIKPRMFAIPMHYNAIIGSIKDAEEFEKLAPCKVVRLD